MTARNSRRSLSLAVATAAIALGAAAARADDNSRISVIEENDSVLFDSDKYYTQGIAFLYLGPDVAVDSAWIGPFEALDWGPFDASGAGAVSRRYEVLLGQSMFTPEDTAREDPDPSDRPYAGWLYGGVGLIQDTDRRRLERLPVEAPAWASRRGSSARCAGTRSTGRGGSVAATATSPMSESTTAVDSPARIRSSSGLRNTARQATDSTENRTHCIQSVPTMPITSSRPTSSAETAKKMKKKPPGVASSTASSTSPSRIQYHQIIWR